MSYLDLDEEELNRRRIESEQFWQELKRRELEEARQKRAEGVKVALLIDDPRSSRNLFRRALEACCGVFVIDTIETGVEAIELATEDLCDLIVVWRGFWGYPEPEPTKTLDETLTWVAQMREKHPALPPIVWLIGQTLTDEEQARLGALRISALSLPVDIDDYERVAQELLGS